MNSRINRKTHRQTFLLVSGGHICAPQLYTKMAFLYKALQIWVKHFFKYLAYELSHRPDSWQGFLYIACEQTPLPSVKIREGASVVHRC